LAKESTVGADQTHMNVRDIGVDIKQFSVLGNKNTEWDKVDKITDDKNCALLAEVALSGKKA